MERATLTKHLKTCVENANRLGIDSYCVRLDAPQDAVNQMSDPDRVKVVRCRDCRFWKANNAEEGDASGMCTNWYSPVDTTDMNWFCADGVRE